MRQKKFYANRLHLLELQISMKENDEEKREELLSCPPPCPRNRRSIPTVFNASKTDEESGFKVPSLLRVS